MSDYVDEFMILDKKGDEGDNEKLKESEGGNNKKEVVWNEGECEIFILEEIEFLMVERNFVFGKKEEMK